MDDYQSLLRKAKEHLPSLGAGTRLEIPAPVVQGTKRQTFIRNFADIAKTVRREPKHLAKFLFKELAVPGNMSGHELVLQGRITQSMIQQRMNEYLRLYVLCEECGKPDTNMTADKGIVTLKCEACGAKRVFHG